MINLALVLVRAADPTPFVPICDRSPQVKAALEKALYKDCDDIDSEDLEQLDYLYYLTNKPLTSLKIGDFSGLFNLKTLHLKNCKLSDLSKEIFQGLSHLKELDLSRNEFSELRVDVFHLNLSQKLLTRI